jgi:DNA-binding IclR family transcriptional regulator
MRRMIPANEDEAGSDIFPFILYNKIYILKVKRLTGLCQAASALRVEKWPDRPIAVKGNCMSTPLNGSVLKAFSILRLFTPARPEISATTVAAELGENTATAHRFLMTLEEAGALVSYRRGYFVLGPLIEELGALAEANNQIVARIRPIIAELALRLNESVMVCRLGRNGPTCIAVASSQRPISVNINVGTVLPMTRSAQGKIFLAAMAPDARTAWLQPGHAAEDLGLTQVHADGYARNRGENEPDIGALSVPLRNEKGEVVLTLSTFGMLRRFDDEMVEQSLPALFAAAQQIKPNL